MSAATANSSSQQQQDDNSNNRRFLQCPGSITVAHLKKFITVKYGLDQSFIVDVIYNDELLDENQSLVDIAYAFDWKKVIIELYFGAKQSHSFIICLLNKLFIKLRVLFNALLSAKKDLD